MAPNRTGQNQQTELTSVIKANSNKGALLAALVALGGLTAGSGVLAASADAAPAPAVDREAARELFHAYSCSACHALADAGSGGSVGPTLDNPTLTRDFVVGRVTDGQGAMPGFGGQMTEAEIALLADYLVEVSHEAAQ
jgi:mono/diheme cytochrome c family protein